MVKAGDLIKLINNPEVHKTHPHVSPDSIGLVMEWNPPAARCSLPSFSAEWGGDGWILWSGHRDWDIEYEEDLEVINET